MPGTHHVFQLHVVAQFVFAKILLHLYKLVANHYRIVATSVLPGLSLVSGSQEMSGVEPHHRLSWGDQLSTVNYIIMTITSTSWWELASECT